MPDKGNWKSYKMPLKSYIHDFTGDETLVHINLASARLR